MGITLQDVFVAREAWQKIVKYRMQPALAYRVGKYARLVTEEDQELEKQRIELVTRYGTAVNGGGMEVGPGSEAYPQFVQQFKALLSVTSDLMPMDITLGTLLEGLEKFNENGVEPADCVALEPFFQPEA